MDKKHIKHNSECSACDILFGSWLNCKNLSANDEIQNLIILMEKWYINKRRSENNPLLFGDFLGLLKLKLERYNKILGYP